MRMWAVLLLSLLAGTGSGATDDSLALRLDSIFDRLADAESPGMAVLVRKDGRTVFERGYGAAELRGFRKIDSRTNFRLASFTKQFTAMSIMLLAHDGKLRYDQPITEIFPEFPAYGRAITIRHLLTHTGGLADYEDLMGSKWTPLRQIRDDEVLQLLEEQSAPKFAAGAKWSYSNSGYVMLGLIVAKVSGMPFWEFLHARIFAPLGMNQTIAFIKGTNVVIHRAYGHSKEPGGFVETDQSPTSATLGDGGVYSNLEDLAKWDAALSAHTLLSGKEFQAALTPVKLNDGAQPSWPAEAGDDNLNPGKPVSYGFGWFLDPYKERARMWHSGSTVGFRTIIDRFTNEKLTVIILCNRADLDATALGLKVADVFAR